MLKEHARLSRQLAITVDAVTVIVAFLLSFYIRRAILHSIPFGAPTSLSDYTLLLIIISFTWWALLNMQNAYMWQRFTSLWTEYLTVLKTTALGTTILVLIAFILRTQNLPRSLIALFAVVSLFLLALEKTLLYCIIGQARKRGRNRKRTLIVGTGKLAREFAATTDKYPEWGLQVIGFLADKCRVADYEEREGIRTLSSEESDRQYLILDPLPRCDAIAKAQKAGMPVPPEGAGERKGGEVGKSQKAGKSEGGEADNSVPASSIQHPVSSIQYPVSSISQKPVLGSYGDLAAILHNQIVEEVVLALPSKDLDAAREMLAFCEQEGVQVRLVSDFFHTMIAKLHVHDIHGMPILTFSTLPMKDWQQFSKRGIDIFVSALTLVVLSPLFLIIAFLVKLTSPGPALYEWHVIGYNKKPFKGYKFRSMVKDADKLREKLSEQNEMSGPVFKMKNDPRITLVGRFLRKFSLDEFPQLWSVLKGDMSLVGPRPCLQTELPRFESWQRRKFTVKPGLTCLWQVNGRNDIKDFAKWAKMDLEYIDNWSLWLDFRILVKTIPVVLLGKGAR